MTFYENHPIIKVSIQIINTFSSIHARRRTARYEHFAVVVCIIPRAITSVTQIIGWVVTTTPVFTRFQAARHNNLTIIPGKSFGTNTVVIRKIIKVFTGTGVLARAWWARNKSFTVGAGVVFWASTCVISLRGKMGQMSEIFLKQYTNYFDSKKLIRSHN